MVRQRSSNGLLELRLSRSKIRIRKTTIKFMNFTKLLNHTERSHAQMPKTLTMSDCNNVIEHPFHHANVMIRPENLSIFEIPTIIVATSISVILLQRKIDRRSCDSSEREVLTSQMRFVLSRKRQQSSLQSELRSIFGIAC